MSEDQRIWVFNDTEQRRSEGTYEQFWEVKNPYLLAKKVLDKSSARKYFSFETLYKGLYSKTNQSVRVDFKMKDQIHKELAKEASKKNLMGIFAEKDTRMIKLKKMKKLIRIKLQDKTISLTTEDCLQVWMHCSGSADQMRTNQGYYQRLLTQKYMDYYRIDIMKDVNRSAQLVDNPEQLLKLENILIAYARRNAYIGYCQGMNYIVAKFLKFGLSEEESFWLLTQLLEDILPLDYFTGVLVGVVCDSRILEQLLRRREETLFKKLSGSPENAIVWNMLFSKGSVTIFKVCLVMLDYCKKEILTAQEYGQVKAVETKLKNWKDVKEFKKRLDRIYVNERGINFMRELYRQVCMIQLEERAAKKTQQPPRRLLNNNPKPPVICDQSLPICLQLMESQSGKTTDKLPPDCFIFKTQRQFYIDHEYFESIRTKDKRNVSLDEMDIMQTLQEHICQPPMKDQEIKEEIEEEEEGKGQEDAESAVAAVIRVKNSRDNKTSSLGGKQEGDAQEMNGELEKDILEQIDERNEGQMNANQEDKESNSSSSPQQLTEIFMSNDREFLQEYASQYNQEIQDHQTVDNNNNNNNNNKINDDVAVVNNNNQTNSSNSVAQITEQNDILSTERHFSRGRQLTADFNIVRRSQNGLNSYQQQFLEKTFRSTEGPQYTSEYDKQADFASQQFNKFNSNNYITYCNPNNNNNNNNKTTIENSSTGNWFNNRETNNHPNQFQAGDDQDEDSHSMQFYSKIIRSRKDYTYLVTAKQHPILDDDQPIHKDGRALSQ